MFILFRHNVKLYTSNGIGLLHNLKEVPYSAMIILTTVEQNSKEDGPNNDDQHNKSSFVYESAFGSHQQLGPANSQWTSY